MTQLTDVDQEIRHAVMADIAIAVANSNHENKEESFRLLSQALFQSKHHKDPDSLDPDQEEGSNI